MGQGFWIGLFLALSAPILCRAQPLTTCYVDSGCHDSGGDICTKQDTSLAVATQEDSQNGIWAASGGPCGHKSCYLFFRCACGEPIGSEVCGYFDSLTTPHGPPTTAQANAFLKKNAAKIPGSDLNRSIGQVDEATASRYQTALAEIQGSSLWRNADPNASNVLPTLVALRAQLAAIGSVHLHASAVVELHGARKAVGNGTFEYWEDGGRHRSRAEVDPRLQLAPNVDLAFDKERFQLSLLESSVQSVKDEESRSLPTPIPNPLLLALDFLSPDDDLCPACAIHVAEARQSDFWTSRVQAARVLPNEPDSVVMPGGVKGGKGFLWIARVSLKGGSRQLSRIDRVSPDGTILGVVSLGDFQPLGGGVPGKFPRKVIVVALDSAGGLQARVTYTIDALEINRPISPDTFKLDTAKTDKVWDSDSNSFLKYTDPNGPTCGPKRK